MTPNTGDPGQHPDDVDQAVLAASRRDEIPSFVGAQRAGGTRPRRALVQDLLLRADAATPRRGWYAYRVVGAATLPSWAAEVALTVERPVDLGPDGSASGNASMGPDPPDPRAVAAQVQAMVLLRSPGTANWLAGIAEAAAEVEAVAGVRQLGRLGMVVESVFGVRPRLLMGSPLPGLMPIPPAAAQVHLATAGGRGLPAPLRRWRPTAGPARLSWRAGLGSVLTCEGPCGVSAQAVVALRGSGTVAAITPPPGGALVLRAWRTSGTWGVACGLVLGAAEALGLGREAGRVAAHARAAGWDAVVFRGMAALQLARAGDHGQAAPEAAAHAASGAVVAALFEGFLAAGGLGNPPSVRPSRALAVSP